MKNYQTTLQKKDISATMQVVKDILGETPPNIQQRYPHCTILYVAKDEKNPTIEIPMENGTLTCPIDEDGKCRKSVFFFNDFGMMPVFFNYLNENYMAVDTESDVFDWADYEKRYGVAFKGEYLFFSFYE